jgi:hypothetical protein
VRTEVARRRQRPPKDGEWWVDEDWSAAAAHYQVGIWMLDMRTPTPSVALFGGRGARSQVAPVYIVQEANHYLVALDISEQDPTPLGCHLRPDVERRVRGDPPMVGNKVGATADQGSPTLGFGQPALGDLRKFWTNNQAVIHQLLTLLQEQKVRFFWFFVFLFSANID